MYRYADYCPVAATTQVIGDYWSPLILRELIYGTNHFNQLARNLPGISRSLLAARLRALERARVVACIRDGASNATSYRLTDAGRDLQPVLDAMTSWGARWSLSEPDPDNLHPMGAICMLKSRVRTDQLPGSRILMDVTAFSAQRSAHAWILCDRQSASVCESEPGFETDLFVRGDAIAMYQLWRQHTTMTDIIRCRRLEVDGPPRLLRDFTRWFDGDA